MSIALCIALFAAGHMVRDGWPAWRPFLERVWPRRPSFVNPTQLARLSGGLVCFAGALCALPLVAAAIVGAAVTAGFWLDQKHGEGQGPDDTVSHTGHNLPFLALSGVSSLVLLDAALSYISGHVRVLPALAGLAKCIIWPFWWNVAPRVGLTRLLLIGNPPESFFVSTRLSAITFGALAGAIVACA